MNLFAVVGPFLGAFVVLMVLGRLIVSEAGDQRKALETGDGKLLFTPNRRSYWGVYLFLALLGYVLLASLVTGIKSGMAPAAICAGFIVLLLAAFPGSIATDDKEISQSYWLRGQKRIAWSDVRSVTLNEKKREVRIAGRSGTKILHARQLPDCERLIEVLKTHCGDKMPGAAAAALKVEAAGKLTSAV
jgi:hypothetical protein